MGIVCYAEIVSNNGDYAAIFLVPFEFLILPCSAWHYYRLSENFIRTYDNVGAKNGVMVIRINYHSTGSWYENWSGMQIATLESFNAESLNISSVNGLMGAVYLQRDTDLIYAPYQYYYSTASSRQLVEVIGNSANVNASFTLMCPEALYGPSIKNVEVVCGGN